MRRLGDWAAFAAAITAAGLVAWAAADLPAGIAYALALVAGFMTYLPAVFVLLVVRAYREERARARAAALARRPRATEVYFPSSDPEHSHVEVQRWMRQ